MTFTFWLRALHRNGWSVFLLAALLAGACRKDTALTTRGGAVRFSVDTLTFDTVFTAAGSATLEVRIFNDADRPVRVSSVRIAGGSASAFRINVDGAVGPDVRDFEIAARDSLFVFATVLVDPTAADAPFVVEDRLVVTTGSDGETSEYSIPLMAYGQNANYIRARILSRDTTWGTDKPFVVIGSALVEEGATLTILPGCRIYMHADSRLVVEGTLLAEGTKEDSIVFQGDRLDRAYFGNRGLPGEWGGLYFGSRSAGSRLTHVILQNGGNTALGAPPALIQLAPDSVRNLAAPQLSLDRVTIRRSLGFGILSFGGTLRAENCLVYSCGAQALAAFEGGDVRATHCTFALRPTVDVAHSDAPAVALLNYFDISNTEYRSRPLSATLTNCIVWGTLDDEIVCAKKGGDAFTVRLDHCVLKTKTASAIPGEVVQIANVFNDPLFADWEKEDHRLKPGSPARDAGKSADVSLDLDDLPRAATPDIGCYEGQ